MNPATTVLDAGELLGALDVGKERLIRAAIAAFAAKGFHGTSTRDIATAAGMSPAAVYVHYRSKEELLFAIARAGHERIRELVDRTTAGSGSEVARLRAFAREFTIAHARGHTTARIVNYELAALSADHYAEIAEIRRDTASRVRGLVASGATAAVFAVADPQMTALALLSLGIDVARWYRDEGAWTPEQVGDHYADLALRMVGAGPGR